MNRYLSVILLGAALMFFGLLAVMLGAFSALAVWNNSGEARQVGSPEGYNHLDLSGVSATIPTTDAAETVPYVGTVVSVTDDQLSITTEGGSETFFVPHDAAILVNGVRSTLADVRPGYSATVSARNQKERKVAERIRAVIEY